MADSLVDVGGLGRRLALTRRIARFGWHRVSQGAAGDRRYQQEVATAQGGRLRSTLDALGRSIATDGWTLETVHLSPPGVELSRGPERVDLRIESPRQRAYARTGRFSIVHRGGADLSADATALIDRFADRVRAAEGESDWRDLIRRPGLTQVEFYPKTGRVELRPNLACNHDCPFCCSPPALGADNEAAGIDDALAQLDTIAGLPIFLVAISGGEPTLLKRLGELIEGVAVRGFRVELQTNGMALADPEYARSLARAGLDQALISLHSTQPEHSDRVITVHEGAWHKTVAGIDQAVAAGIRVDLSHVIHSANATEAADFVRFVHQRWGRKVRIRMAFVSPTGLARTRAAELIPPMPLVVPSVLEALRYARQHRVGVSLVSYCGIPPCLVGAERRFSDIGWGTAPAEHKPNHIKLPACESCRLRSKCPGLWREYYDLHGDPGLTPVR